MERVESPSVEGKEVLEVGCGRALIGLLCEQLGARRVVLTDCDDRVLGLLAAHCADSRVVSVRHLLWEQDQWEEQVGHAATQQRHWSAAYRDTESIPALEYGAQFDVIIACECLYFPSQEAPLLSVLRQRLRKPDGQGVIVVQQRAGEASQIIRFLASLSADFSVREIKQPWDYEKLLRDHVRCIQGQEELVLTETANDCDFHQIVLVTWKKKKAT